MRQYSRTNQVLIVSQCPQASDCKPFKAWAAEGRRVKKGEKAIKIWAPRTKTTTIQYSEELSEEQKKTYFRLVNVFDVSQTETQEEWEARKAAEEAAEQQTEEVEQPREDYAVMIGGVIVAEVEHHDLTQEVYPLSR